MNFCGNEEMQYKELRIRRNVRQRTARRRNAETKICGRRNADEEMHNKEMPDEDLSGHVIVMVHT